MNVYTDIDNLPNFTNAVITTGSFDGVHVGHVLIIEQLIAEARKIGGIPIIISFYPHPKHVVGLEQKPIFTLNTPAEKYRLLQQKGIEHIIVVPFSQQFSEQTATEYITEFLVAKCKPAVIVVGYDHKFGKNRAGNFELLEQLSAQLNYSVKEIPEHILKNVTISSTKIRAALQQGDIDTAASFLGYNYFFSGLVVLGNQLGRTIGYPTANLQIQDEHKLIPAVGVYAVDIVLEKRPLKGMMNIGYRPTVNGKTLTIEVNIFNFDEDIYGQTLQVTLKKYLRSEVKFTGLDALKNQLANDKKLAVELN